MAHVMTTLRQLLLWDNGQDLLEYGLLAALIAIVAMASISTLGTTIFSVFWSGIAQAL